MKHSDVPESFKPLMSPQDQATYFPAVPTPEKLTAANSADHTPRLERQEHSIFLNWLLSHNFAFRHSRTDKATRETAGAPDFTVYDKIAPSHGQIPLANCLAIEFKLPPNKLSTAQAAWANNYGAKVHIVHSALDAIKLVTKYFGT